MGRAPARAGSERVRRGFNYLRHVAATMTGEMYRGLAPYYDRIYGFKDYRGEARLIHRLVRRYGPPRAHRLLDVACGTGSHLLAFSRWYTVEGVDASPAMLRLARRKLPRVPLYRREMTRLGIRRPVDVVTCLFSSIAYLRSDRELLSAFRGFYAALRPRGVVFVEPWIEPGRFHAALVSHRVYVEPGLTVVRMNSSRRRWSDSILDFHYLVGESGRVRHFRDTQRIRLVPARHLVALLEKAGFRAHLFRRGLSNGRGLLMGVRPARVGMPRKGGNGA